jgi:hypothetical protein
VGIDLFLHSYNYVIFKRLQDMAVARSCLTFWVCCIVVPMFFDPPITVPGLSSDDQNQPPVGDGREASRLGLAEVS